MRKILANIIQITSIAVMASSAQITGIEQEHNNSDITGIIRSDNRTTADIINIYASSEYAEFKKALAAANALTNSTIEGMEEGQYAIGSKSILQASINQAQAIIPPYIAGI
jgi:hypothetical protein